MSSQFSSCMTKNGQQQSEALRCCMKGCRKDIDCQEGCIESYNSLIPIKETFILGLPVNRKLLFLFAVIIFHSLVILGRIQIPSVPKNAIVYITIIYTLIYYFIYNIL